MTYDDVITVFIFIMAFIILLFVILISIFFGK